LANFAHADQAEGLRRMLAAPRPRVVTLLSALTDEGKNATLTNLAASLAGAGSDALLLDAIGSARGIAAHLGAMPAASVLDAALCERKESQLVQAVGQGFGLAVFGLSPGAARVSNEADAMDGERAQRLNEVYDRLARSAGVLLIDAELDAEDNFPLAAMGEGEIVVLVSTAAQSIKQGYAIIKRLAGKLGKRPFGVLVTGASDQEAQVVYRNMALAASRYLAVQLTSMGAVPADEHMARAARLGRSVVDAFPMARAAVAFRHLAGRLAASGAAGPHFPAQAAMAGPMGRMGQ
jgi:flagellar biosynthesis protein FlhG